MFQRTRRAKVSAGALAAAAGPQAPKVEQVAVFDIVNHGATHCFFGLYGQSRPGASRPKFLYGGSKDHLRRIGDMSTFYRLDE